MTAGLIGVGVGALGTLLPAQPAVAATGINKAINFQGKLVNSNGTNVPNGTYNMEFQLYTGGGGCVSGGTSPCGGTSQWTEDWLRNAGQGVTVTDGIFQVDLGSHTSLPAIFNNDTIWLSINLGNTNATCTPFTSCAGDGEMLPFIRFTAAPYALNSDLLDGLDSSQLAQLNPASAQSGSLNVTGSMTAATSLQSPLVDNTGTLGLGTGSGTTATTVGRANSGTNLTLQGSASTSWTATGASGTTTVNFNAPTANTTLKFPASAAGTYTICTTDAGSCSATYQAAGSYLAKNATDSSSFAVTAANYLYGFTNSSSAVASGVLKLDNGSNTSNALYVTASGNPGSGKALIVANNTAGSPSGNLIDLQVGGTSKFAVDTTGAVTAGTYNGQTISSTASFTGTVATANTLTVSSGGIAVTGNSTITGSLSNLTTLTFASGTTTTNFTSPVGASVATKINIPTFTVPANGQVLAFGANSSSDATARVLSLFDARTAAHQPTLSVFDPTENNVVGFSWEGTSGTAYLKTTGGNLVLRSGATDLMTLLSVGGGVGIGVSPAYKLDVNGDANVAALSTYKIGGTTVCSGTTCTPAAGSANYIQNQNAAAQATSNFWISGTGRADTSLVTPLVQTVDAATASTAIVVRSGNTTGGSGLTTGAVTIKSGDGTGTNTNTGNVTVDAGAKSGSGNGGNVYLGTTNALSVNVGRNGGTGNNSALSLMGTATTSNLILSNGANTFQTTIGFTSPTATRTVTFADASGTVCLDSGNCSAAGGYIVNGTSLQTASFNVSGTGGVGGALTVGGTYNGNTFTSSALTFSAAAGATVQSAASQALTLSGHNTAIWGTDAGNLTVQASAASANLTLNSGASGTVAIDNTDAIHTVNIAAAGSTTAQTVAIGSSNTGSATTVEGATINIGTANAAHAINIGNNAGAAQTLVFGSTNAGTTLAVNTGAFTESHSNTGITVQSNTNSATAVQLQNASGANVAKVGTTDTNLIANPGAEVAFASDWSAYGSNTTVSRNTSNAWNGAGSVSVVVTPSTGTVGAKNALGAALTTSTTYTLSFYAKLKSGDPAFADISARYLRDGSTVDATCANFNTQTVISGGWTRVSCTLAVSSTAGNSSAAVAIYQSAAAARTFYLDGVQLEQTSNVANVYGAGSVALDAVVTSPVGLQNTEDSTNALDVQNAAGTSQFKVDTLNSTVSLSATGILQANTITPTAAMTVGSTGQNLTLQGAGGTKLTATNAGNTVQVGFATINGSGTYQFASPTANTTYTICTTDTASCGGASGSYLRKNVANETSSANLGTNGDYLYSFSNAGGSVTTDVLQLNGASATGSALHVTSASSATAGNALILANDTLNNATGNLLDLWSTQSATSASRFAVSTTGAVTMASTLNGQTISSTANFTGTLATGGLLTANSLSVTNGATFNAGATVNTNALTTNAGITDTGNVGIANGNLTFSGTGGGVTGLTGLTFSSASSIDTNAALALSIGNTNASQINIGKSTATQPTISLQGNVSSVFAATGASGATTLAFAALTATGKTVTIPNETGTICTSASTSQATNCTNFAPATLGTGYIQNQNGGQQASSNFWISGTGRADTSLLTPTLDTATAVPLNIGATTAVTTAINLNQNTTLASGKSLTVQGALTQSNGTFSLAGNGASSLTTTASALTITSAAAATWSTAAGALTVSGFGGATVSTPNAATGGTNNVSVISGNATTSGGTGTVSIASGNVTSAGTAGTVSVDTGSGSSTGTPTVSVGTANATAVNIGRTAATTTNGGNLVTGTAGSSQFTNNGSTLNSALALGDLASGNMGASAAATVNVYTAFTISPTASGRTYTILAPTTTTAGRVIYVSNINATNSFTLAANTSVLINPGVTATLVWNGSVWTFAGTDASNLQAAYNNSSGAAPSILETATNKAVTVQSAFTSGIAAGNELLGVRAAASGDVLGASLLTVSSYGLGINLGDTGQNPAMTSGYDLQFGGGANRTIAVISAATANAAGANLTVQAGAANGSSTGNVGGDLILKGGAAAGTGANNGGAVSLQGGTASGTGAGGTASLLGGFGSATAGSVGGAVAVTGQNGATGSGATTGGAGGAVGVTSGSGGAGSGTNSSGGNGSNVTITAGSGGAATGTGTNGNGGNIRLIAGNAGGTANGTPGVVEIDTPVFTAASETVSSSSYTVTQANIDGFSTVVLTDTSFTNANVTVPAPRNTTAGRIIYITSSNSSVAFTLAPSGGPTVNMLANDTAMLVWNGAQWTASASSSSLQQVYNNTSTSPASIVTTSSTKTLTVQAGSTFDSTSLLQVSNSNSAPVLTVDSTTTNMFVNSGFETGTTSWGQKGTATITQDSTAGNFYHGKSAIKAVTSATTSGITTTGSQAAFTANIAASTQYTVSFYAKCSSAVTITWGRQDNGADTGTSTGSCTTQWQQFSSHWTTGATIGTVAFFITAPASATTIWADGMSLVQTSTTTANPYRVGAVALGGVLTEPAVFMNNSDSTTAFQIMNAAGTSLFNVDTANAAIRIGDATNYVSFTAATREPVLNGTARHTKNIKLTAEYAGAVLDIGTSGANTGSMTAAFDTTNRTSYYNWTTSQSSAQTYDVVVQLPIPDDWAAWNGNPTFRLQTSSTGSTNQAVKATIIRSDGTTDTNYNNITLVTAALTTNACGTAWSVGVWYTSNCVALNSGAGQYSAGGVMTIRMTLSASGNNSVKLSDITLPYLSKW